MKRSTLALILVPLLLGGCASGPSSAAGGPATEAARPDPNLLREDDLQGFGTAMTAIRAKRSQWLRMRSAGGLSGGGQIQVYLDGMRMGGPDVLERMSTAEIASIEYIEGRMAFQRWGLGHENGVIFVSTRNR